MLGCFAIGTHYEKKQERFRSFIPGSQRTAQVTIMSQNPTFDKQRFQYLKEGRLRDMELIKSITFGVVTRLISAREHFRIHPSHNKESTDYCEASRGHTPLVCY
jgi:hypothetical protein